MIQTMNLNSSPMRSPANARNGHEHLMSPPTMRQVIPQTAAAAANLTPLRQAISTPPAKFTPMRPVIPSTAANITPFRQVKNTIPHDLETIPSQNCTNSMQATPLCTGSVVQQESQIADGRTSAQ